LASHGRGVSGRDPRLAARALTHYQVARPL
jgi:hypothetical protein